MIGQSYGKVLGNYLDTLVDRIFKILPMKEENADTLNEYMQGLQLELIGCSSLFVNTGYDSVLLSLISILQYLIDNDCDVDTVRRQVFTAIDTCKKLKRKYFTEETEDSYGHF